MVIYYLSVRNYKKLIKKLNYETFYYNVKDERKILEEFVNEKQQIMIVTNVFGIRIDVADIKVIVHANEPKTMLDYAQENGRTGWNKKRNEVMVVRKRIKGGGGGRRGGGRKRKRKKRRKRKKGIKGGKKSKNEKQMEWKKMVKFLEAKC